MKAEYLENELIDSYLNGNLKGDELFSFESRLNLDTDFATKVNGQKDFNQSFEDHQLSKFHNRLDEFNPYKNPKLGSGITLRSLILGGVVLSGLTIASLSFFNTNNDKLETVIVNNLLEF